MAAPVTRFRPGVSPDREPPAAAPQAERKPAVPPGSLPRLVLSGAAVEFETVISPAGVLSVLPRVQRLIVRETSARPYPSSRSCCGPRQ